MRRGRDPKAHSVHLRGTSAYCRNKCDDDDGWINTSGSSYRYGSHFG